jgi:hypothetical protein
MNIILGFGAIEERGRRSVQDALGGMESESDVRCFIEKWNKDADQYDKLAKADAPERYTRLYFYDDQLHFHHINRRHPFSPDGWALLIIREPFLLNDKMAT